MDNNIISTLDEQFKKDCKVISLKYEYPGYTGIEQWAIITNLSEEELNIRYSKQITPLKPFIVLSASFGEVRREYKRNEDKYHKRSCRSIDPFDYDDELIAVHHPELVIDTFDEYIIQSEECERIRTALTQLEPKQKERIVKYFFDGLSTSEIAKEENTSRQAVLKSINAAIKKLKKTLI